MSESLEFFITFILRLTYSVEMICCAIAILYIRAKFNNKTIKQVLKHFTVWLVALAVSRLIGSLIDYCFSQGSGFIPLIVSNSFWLYVLIKLLIFIFKFLRVEEMKKITVERTENLIEDVSKKIAENKKKIDEAIEIASNLKS